MKTSRLLLIAIALGLPAIAGCECGSPTTGAPNVCSLPSPPTGCGAMCSATVACPTGTHCDDATSHCVAECSADHPCSGGHACSANGTCLGVDSGTPRDGTIGSTDTNTPPDDTTCASTSIGTMLATPNVIVVVDESGSMGMNDFPAGSGTSRWDALENALMAMPGGLIYSLQGSVRWGMAWYHGGSGCPNNVETVACALNNYDAINAQYMGLSPGGATPTGESLEVLLDRRATLISDPTQPTIIILATDGDPNTCADRNDSAGGQMRSVAAVTRALGLGIPTYVISVGSDADQARLQEVANAGTSTPPGMVYLANDTTTLSAALTSIVGGVVSCNLTLMGMIDPAQACSGSVTLAGTALTCNDPNGWHAIDATHIALDGTACDMLLGGATPLDATFPCGVILN